MLIVGILTAEMFLMLFVLYGYFDRVPLVPDPPESHSVDHGGLGLIESHHAQC